MSTPDSQVRVRFSPSPTGLCLHIGGARTTLFNWAWAKKTGGRMLLRVEDTDAARSTEASKQVILDSLRWLGLDWQEGVDVGGDCGPYVQSERKHIYRELADKLIAEEKAYRCYCSDVELTEAREQWTRDNPKVGFKYPGTCKGKPLDDTRPYVIRLVAKTEGTTTFDDLVFGRITTPNVENQDWVIIRTDGLPLYNFGCVADDALMGITLAARGADHLQNTIPQMLMYEALGFTPPTWVHMPLIRGKDNEKLSKRNASVGVFEYRDQGYAPSALLNYLARLGWSKGDAEVFSMDEFVEMFDWSNCVRKDSKWDPAKLAAINTAHLRSERLVPDAEYAAHTLPFIQKLGLTATTAQLLPLIPLIRPRAKTFVEAAWEMEPFLQPTVTPDQAATERFLTNPNRLHMANLAASLADLKVWSQTGIAEYVNGFLGGWNLTIRDLGQPIRVALMGRTTSPELFATMAALGKETVLTRLKAVVLSKDEQTRFGS